MSLKSLYQMAMGLVMASQGMEAPTYSAPRKEKTNAEKKKCKSCALFRKTTCPKKYRDPWGVACENYKKK